MVSRDLHKGADTLPAITTEAVTSPSIETFVGQPQVHSPVSDTSPALKLPDKISHYPPPWFKPVNPLNILLRSMVRPRVSVTVIQHPQSSIPVCRGDVCTPDTVTCGVAENIRPRGRSRITLRITCCLSAE